MLCVLLKYFFTNYDDINYIARYNCQQSVFHWQYLISDIFSISLKFRACYITDHWANSQIKNATVFYILVYFFGTFLLFFIICFYHFHFFFNEVSNFRNSWPIRNRNWRSKFVSGILWTRQFRKFLEMQNFNSKFYPKIF